MELLLYLQAVIGIFACIGLYLTIRILLDAIIKQKSGVRLVVYIEACTGDPEYAVRFAESRFVHGEYAGFFSRVALSHTLTLSDEQRKKLQAEYPELLYPTSLTFSPKRR